MFIQKTFDEPWEDKHLLGLDAEFSRKNLNLNS